MNFNSKDYNTQLSGAPVAYSICEKLCNAEGKVVNFAILEASSEFHSLPGYQNKSIIGKKITDIFPDFFQEYPQWIPRIEKIFQEGAVSFDDYVFTDNRWYNTLLIPLDDKKYLVVIHDSTDIRKQNEELQNAENNLLRIFGAAEEGFLLFDKNGVLLSANEKAAQMYGSTVAELKAAGPEKFIHPDSQSVFQQFLKEVSENGFFSGNASGYKKDGTSIDIIVKGISLQSKQETYCLAVISDITEERKVRQTILDMQNRLQDVLENISDCFFTLSNDYLVTYINKTSLNYLSMSAEDIIGKNLYDIFPLLKNSVIEKEFQRAFKNQKHSFFEAFVNNIWLEMKLSPHSDGISVFFRDITEKKKIEREKEELIKQLTISVEKEQNAYSEMEAAYEEMQSAFEESEQAQRELEKLNVDLNNALDKAQESERVKSDFLGVLSHELRTPLAGMMGFSQLLCQADDVKGIYKQYAEFINTSGKRLLDVLNDLLEMSSLESGRINLGLTDINVKEVIDDVYILLQTRFMGKGIAFNVELKDNEIVYSDKTRIRQILFNLIGNAVKFTNEGSVTVRVRKETDNYIFEIEDTGIGIDDKDREIVFEMFKQSEHHLRRKYQGTGLGLAICKKLVQVLGGNIWLRSEKGKGSIFYFSLPLKRVVHAPQAVPVDTTERKNKPISILFAEDDDVNFQLIERIISSNDYNYKGFYNGYDLVKHFANDNDFNLILLDIHMPVMNGIEAMREIRKLNTDIPVIAITAFAMPADRKKYLELGFSDYIAKPIIPEEFNQTILENYNEY